MEQWKQIENHHNYLVSSEGRILSIKKNYKIKERLLKPWKTKKGYLAVQLNSKTYVVHRLVASAFLPNPDKHTQINHKNEIKTDNQVDNLEWCDGFYNQEYSHAKSFQFINPDGVVVNVFNLNKFCRDNNLEVSNMHNLFTGRIKSNKGWRKAT